MTERNPVGQLIYGSTGATVEIDDRTLAHLKVVMITKLRRGEGFAFSWEEDVKDGSGRSTIWVHPAVSLQFKFFGTRQPSMNKLWLEELMSSANSGGGLHVLPEHDATEANSVPPIY
jgi:hypothetical protein